MKNTFLYLCAATVLLVSGLGAASTAPAFKEPDHTRNLSGKVISRQDQPIGRAIVYLKNTKSLAIKTYITEPDGTYRFPSLSPNIDYEVYAEHNGARSDTKTVSAFDTRKQFNINLQIK